MSVLVVSDIHGSEEGMKLVLGAVRHYGCDRILSAGDQCPDPLFSSFYSSLTAVRGNCDRFYEYDHIPFPPLYREEKIYGRNVFMTHGDRMGVDDFPLKKGDVFISGHTHVPLLYMDEKGFYVLNPGSPSRPRSSEGPSAALFEEDGLSLISLLSMERFSTLYF